jgi:hypothetical protein
VLLEVERREKEVLRRQFKTVLVHLDSTTMIVAADALLTMYPN